MFGFTTAGESHGPGLAVIVTGVPAGLKISEKDINADLLQRQQGAGRGGRMKIESDQVEILSGIRFGQTIGSPIAMIIRNRDWQNWSATMSQEEESAGYEPITTPRPGHADFAGLLKTGQYDIRNILERASARETACRVAAGAVGKKILGAVNIVVGSHVVQIGKVVTSHESTPNSKEIEKADKNDVRCIDDELAQLMKIEIEKARQDGDSLGGVFEVLGYGVVAGLGSYASWDERLDGRLAQALMSIPAIKAVEVGSGVSSSKKRGAEVHDEFFYHADRGFYRKTNHAGGLEGGMTNGETLVLRAYMKPIPTLAKPLRTVDISTKKPALALKERADVCAVPAAAVIGEAMVAIELTKALLEKFGGDCMEDLLSNYQNYVERIGSV